MKQKLKALASLCLALALTLCLTLPAWAAGDGDAAGQRITQETKGSIKLEWNTNDTDTVTSVTAYKVIWVDYQYPTDPTGEDNYEAPKDPEFFWVDGVAGWVRANFSTYIGKVGDNAVQEAFATTADSAKTLADGMAAAIRRGDITLTSVGEDKYNSEMHTFSNLEMGSYLILVEGGTKIYSPIFVSLEPEWNENSGWTLPEETVQVTPKAENLSLKKKVYDKETLEDTDYAADSEYAQVAIGDTVTYVVEADVPNYPDNAISTGYKISDNLPDGMTLGNITVYGLGADGGSIELSGEGQTPAYEETREGAQRPDNVTEGAKDVAFILNFTYSRIKEFDKIRVVYTATANKDIKVVGDSEGQDTNITGNVNTAYLDYNNNPYETTGATWQTAHDTATVYTYGLKVDKKSDTKDATGKDVYLPGAEFTLTKNGGTTPIHFVYTGAENTTQGTYRVATPTEITDENIETTTTLTVGESGNNMGKLSIYGLDVDTYILKETKAPAGYNLLSQPKEFTITDAKDNDAEQTATEEEKNTPDGIIDDEEGVADDKKNSTGYISFDVINTQGFTLPTTGGMGTVLFTAGGVVLMGAGLVLLVVFLRRRRAK